MYVLLKDLVTARSIASQKLMLIFDGDANAEVPGVPLANLSTSVPLSVVESGMAWAGADWDPGKHPTQMILQILSHLIKGWRVKTTVETIAVLEGTEKICKKHILLASHQGLENFVTLWNDDALLHSSCAWVFWCYATVCWNCYDSFFLAQP